MVKQVRFSMELIRKILQLKWEGEKSNRMIERTLKVSRTTVATYLHRVSDHGLASFEQINSLSDCDLMNYIDPNPLFFLYFF